MLSRTKSKVDTESDEVNERHHMAAELALCPPILFLRGIRHVFWLRFRFMRSGFSSPGRAFCLVIHE